MSFLSPFFLWGLLALPIPFIIHFLHRHRMERQWFSSLMLIQRAEQGEKAFRKLKDILLLILRTLVLLLLVFAFANPVLHKKQKTILLDDSYDMFTKTAKGTLFELGVKTALRQKGARIILASGDSVISTPKYQKFPLIHDNIDCIITKSGKIASVRRACAHIPVIELTGREDNFAVSNIDYSSGKVFVSLKNYSSTENIRQVMLCTPYDTTEKLVSIPGNSGVTIIFPLASNFSGPVKVALNEDALDIDNTKYLIVTHPPPIKVSISGDPSLLFFLKNALAPDNGNSNIAVGTLRAMSLLALSYDATVVVNGTVGTGRPAMAGSLQNTTQKTLFIPEDATPVNGFLTIGKISENHPVFNGFDFIPELKRIKFYYRNICRDIARNVPHTRVIAEFSDGTPAIIETATGNICFTFPLNQQSKEFVISPLFVPFIHRIVYWLAGKPLEKHNFVVGAQVKFKVPELKTYKCNNLTTGDGYQLYPTAEETGIYVGQATAKAGSRYGGSFSLAKPGFYEIAGITQFAVNITDSIVSSTSTEPLNKMRGIELKKFLLIFVFLLLIVELMLLHSRTNNKKK